MNETDEQLVEAYRKGDERAFARLTERYLRSIFSYISRISNSGEETNDLVQETFVKAWKKLAQFDTSKNFKAWLFAIAYHVVIDWSRKKKNIVFSKIETDDFRLEDVLEDPEPLPEELFLKKELSEELERALGELPIEYRNILMLYLENEFTFAQMAEVLGRPLNTVKSQYRRGALLLRDILVSVHQK